MFPSKKDTFSIFKIFIFNFRFQIGNDPNRTLLFALMMLFPSVEELFLMRDEL